MRFARFQSNDLFVRRGKLLSIEIAKQLDGDWRVIYFDDIARQEIVITASRI